MKTINDNLKFILYINNRKKKFYKLIYLKKLLFFKEK